MNFYIGSKQIQARPMNLGDYNKHRGWTIPEDEDPGCEGYLVVYPDGYQSWSPAETFEAAYLVMDGDGSKITERMVDKFTLGYQVSRSGEKTTVVTARLANGYEITETSSCVDPANYDEELGARLAKQRIRDRVWMLLGFLLQTARNGVST